MMNYMSREINTFIQGERINCIFEIRVGKDIIFEMVNIKVNTYYLYIDCLINMNWIQNDNM